MCVEQIHNACLRRKKEAVKNAGKYSQAANNKVVYEMRMTSETQLAQPASSA